MCHWLPGTNEGGAQGAAGASGALASPLWENSSNVQCWGQQEPSVRDSVPPARSLQYTTPLTLNIWYCPSLLSTWFISKSLGFSFFFKFNFIFKLYIIVLVLPNIKMNPPQVYMCLFLIWLHSFILSGVISPLISSSILGTYRPGQFIFQCPIFLPFHTVHGVLKERILKWFAIPFSSGPHSVRPLHHDPAILGGPTWHGLVSLS